MFTIKEAKKEDLPQVKELIQWGRKRQIESGNLNQWGPDYPSMELLEKDLCEGTIYLCEHEGKVIGTFSLFTTPDPTYKKIVKGEWLNNQPYATIHRIATDGSVKGAGQYCIKWVQERFDNVRIDTHEDNAAMRHILEKLGFQEVGIIYLANGDERLAFHFAK